jgi:hypothetical protein
MNGLKCLQKWRNGKNKLAWLATIANNMEKPTSKTRLPEFETEIAKLQAINKILTDWLFYGGRNTPTDEKDKTRFDQFYLLAPFAITDIEPLTKAIRRHRNNKALLPCLNKLKAIAETNLRLYEEGEGKEQVKRTLYYFEEGGGIERAISEDKKQEIEAHKTRQLIQFMFVVGGYCREVINYISEPISILKKEKEASKLKPLPHEGITVAQIALFFYYLSEGRVLVHDSPRKFFKTEKGHEKPPYNFTGVSSQTIYSAYLILREGKHTEEEHKAIMNPNNLKAIIPYLKKYPAAHGKAKNDLYSMEKG